MTVSTSVGRGRHRARFVATAALLLPQLASAQTTSPPAPALPDSRVISPGGVDLRSGLYAYHKTDLSIGDESKGGIVLARGTRSQPEHAATASQFPDAFGQFSHSWDVHLSWTNSPKNMHTVSVTAMGVSYSFQTNSDFSSPTLKSRSAYATLAATWNGSVVTFTLTTASGMVVKFLGATTVITKPDGVVYTLSYGGAASTNSSSALRSVVSNSGYVLLFEYATGTPWPLIGKACVVNLSQTQMPNLCPAGAATTTYAYSGTFMTSAVDAAGAAWTYSTSPQAADGTYTEKFFRPGEAAPYLTLGYTTNDGPEAVAKETFADGRWYDYTWYGQTYGCPYGSTDCSEVTFPLGGGYTENGVNHTDVGFYVGPYSSGAPPIVSPGPTSITDPLNRTYSFQYNAIPGTLSGMTTPEGLQETYARDGCRNVTKRTVTPKSGSNLTPITTSATFGNCGVRAVAADSPTAVVDANNNQTDMTYDPVSGLLTSMTGPAVNGVRPQTRYGYVQRYAWVLSGGSYVRAASPIWLLAQESRCRTGAPGASGGCALAGDEVITSYDYGPDSGPNTLLLRGKVEDATGVAARTCYAYDKLGQKISETKPNAHLASCS